MRMQGLKLSLYFGCRLSAEGGLEVVEKLLTSTIYAANKTAWARSSAQGIVAP